MRWITIILEVMFVLWKNRKVIQEIVNVFNPGDSEVDKSAARELAVRRVREQTGLSERKARILVEAGVEAKRKEIDYIEMGL